LDVNFIECDVGGIWVEGYMDVDIKYNITILVYIATIIHIDNTVFHDI
jgi:hypothetical protein